jgi:hypothetical protein
MACWTCTLGKPHQKQKQSHARKLKDTYNQQIENYEMLIAKKKEDFKLYLPDRGKK